LKGCNVGITDCRDLCSAPLKWAQVAWYIIRRFEAWDFTFPRR
jgi:hypothetical protein